MIVAERTAEIIYFTNFEEDEPDLVHIGLADFPRARSGLLPHIHPGTMEVICVESGVVHYYVGEECFEVQSGQAFVAFPDEVHGSGPMPEERSSLGWIAFRLGGDGNVFLSRHDEAAITLRQYLRKIDLRVFKISPETIRMLHLAVKACQSRQPFANMMLHGAVVTFAGSLINDYLEASRQNVTTPSSVIRQAGAWIDDHLKEPITLSALAAAVELPLPTLKYKFKREMGISPYNYAMRKKVFAAAAGLCSGKANITELAYQFGFSSSQHFATTFRQWMSCSPSEYRKKHGR